MTCRSCGFENMKRNTVCARCGAKLVWDGPVRKRDFTPKTGANGPISRFFKHPAFIGGRLRRRLSGIVSTLGIFRRIPRENLRHGYASIVPGLGLFQAGRKKHAAAYMISWALVLLLTLLGTRMQVPAAQFGPGVLALLHTFSIIAALHPADFCRTNGEARLVALAVAIAVLIVYAFATYLFLRNVFFEYTVRRYDP